MITAGVDIWKKNPLLMTKITIKGRPYHHRDTSILAVVVETAEGLLYDHCKAAGPLLFNQGQKSDTIEVVTGPLLLQGDVTIRVFRLDEVPELSTQGQVCMAGRQIKYGSISGKCVSFVTFNTAFHESGLLSCLALQPSRDTCFAGSRFRMMLPDVTFMKPDIDEAYKDKHHYRFPADYSMVISPLPSSLHDVRA
eukprot:1203988-Rhodomonas_salina.2